MVVVLLQPHHTAKALRIYHPYGERVGELADGKGDEREIIVAAPGVEVEDGEGCEGFGCYAETFSSYANVCFEFDHRPMQFLSRQHHIYRYVEKRGEVKDSSPVMHRLTRQLYECSNSVHGYCKAEVGLVVHLRTRGLEVYDAREEGERDTQ